MFDAIVVELDARRGGATMAIRSPAIGRAAAATISHSAAAIKVRLQEVDVMRRLVRFEKV